MYHHKIISIQLIIIYLKLHRTFHRLQQLYFQAILTTVINVRRRDAHAYVERTTGHFTRHQFPLQSTTRRSIIQKRTVAASSDQLGSQRSTMAHIPIRIRVEDVIFKVAGRNDNDHLQCTEIRVRHYIEDFLCNINGHCAVGLGVHDDKTSGRIVSAGLAYVVVHVALQLCSEQQFNEIDCQFVCICFKLPYLGHP